MATTIRQVDYFTATVKDEPGEGSSILTRLAELGINLVAFTGVPVGPTATQVTLFPDDTARLVSTAHMAGIQLQGPHHALLVQGDDKLGALAEIHQTLYAANVNIYASSGVTDGRGGFGYLLYVRPEQFEDACKALGI